MLNIFKFYEYLSSFAVKPSDFPTDYRPREPYLVKFVTITGATILAIASEDEIRQYPRKKYKNMQNMFAARMGNHLTNGHNRKSGVTQHI